MNLSIENNPYASSMTQHPDTLPPIQDSRSVSRPQPTVPLQTIRPFTFACPIFQYNNYHRQQHVCIGTHGRKMADVRNHLIKGRKKHLEFLACCPVCNEDVLIKEDFEDFHGENCRKPPSRRRDGTAGEAQWKALYRKLYPMEKHIPSACTYRLAPLHVRL